MAGEIVVKWKNIRELTSSKPFAVLKKNVKLTRRDADALVPEGTLHVANGTITVDGKSGARSVPIADTAYVIEAGAFEKVLNHPPTLVGGWAGSVSAGASLVRATQNATTFTGALALSRATPGVDWLPLRTRTLLNYNQAYGTVSQAGTPTVKSNIFHANGEEDQYFSPRLYAFGSATYDHNFSQSLDLEQAYGGGIGITLLKGRRQQLDFKGDAHYLMERFFDPTQNANLFGSTFSETYVQHLPRSLVLNEFASATPSWNVTNDYSAHVNANLLFPLFKGLGFNIGAVDDYLNNAPPGNHKNSSQFTTGITYTIRPR